MKLTDYHRIVMISVVSMLASGYTMFYLYAYLPEMVLWMGYDEDEKGYYTGILTGCFYIGAMITNYPFGVLANKYGHRNMLMSLLVINGVLNITLSFCRGIYSWIILRFMLGLCHPVFGLSRAIVSLYSDDSNHGIAMAINVATTRVAYFLSSIIGGFLVSLKVSQFFYAFPFFIPPCVGGMLGVIGAVTTYFMYPKDKTDSADDIPVTSCTYSDNKQDHPNTKDYERLQEEPENIAAGQNISNKKGYSTFECDRETNGEFINVPSTSSGRTKTDLHDHCAMTDKKEQSGRSKYSDKRHLVSRKHGINNTDSTAMSAIATREVLLKESDDKSNTDKTSNSQNGDKIKTDKTAKTPNKNLVKSCWNTIKQHASKFANFLKDMRVLKICVGGLCITGGGTGFDQLFPVWMSTIPNLGGLGYTHGDIGTVYVIVSLPAACALLLIPILERRLGAIYACTLGLVVSMILISVVPLGRFVKSAQGLFVLMCVFHFMYMVLLSACISYSLLILSNCVPKNEIGAIHGLGQTCNTVGGALVPIVGGMVFSSSIVSDFGIPVDPSLAFVVVGYMFWIASVMFVTLPASLNYMPKDELGNRL